MTATLTIVQDTWFTLRSADLPDDQKHHVLAGESFTLLSYEVIGDFMRVTLDRNRLSESNPFNENLTWYVNEADVTITQAAPSRLGFFSKIVTRFFSPTKIRNTDTPPNNPSKSLQLVSMTAQNFDTDTPPSNRNSSSPPAKRKGISN